MFDNRKHCKQSHDKHKPKRRKIFNNFHGGIIIYTQHIVRNMHYIAGVVYY